MNDDGPRDQLILGDCALVLKTLPDSSVDAIICDPPSGTAFMGAHWDTNKGGRDQWIAWLAGIMAEALRVLKPGGHALVWALPRTSHWTGMALDNAGFEVRDCVTHLFGSGFPKSLNVGESIDKVRDRSLLERLSGEIKRARLETGISVAEVGRRMMEKTNGQYGQWYHRCGHFYFESGRALPSRPEWLHLHSILPISNDFVGVFDEAEREVLGRRAVHPGVAFTSAGPSFLDITLPSTDAAKQWDGWGTATKPAAEFWFLCRKPLAESTIAGNVLAWGTGGLNIDACRVGTDDLSGQWDREWNQDGTFGNGKRASFGKKSVGRWPANLLLSHHESCVCVGDGTVRANGSVSGNEPSAPTLHVYGEAERKPFVAHGNGDGTEDVEQWVCAEGCPVRLLDEQAGDRRSAGNYTKGARAQGDKSGPASIPIDGLTSSSYADAGSASRFFTTFAPAEDAVPFRYVPKPSRRERDMGLDGMPEKYLATMGDGVAQRHHNPDQAGAYSKNNHPTLKSVSLMRWLCRLVTPPGGTVLDPFMGSGSTGVACAVEGFSFIGIEQEPDYYAISERRIAYARAHPDAFTGKTKPATIAPAQQPALAPPPTARRRKGPRMEMVSLFGNEEGVG